MRQESKGAGVGLWIKDSRTTIQQQVFLWNLTQINHQLKEAIGWHMGTVPTKKCHYNTYTKQCLVLGHSDVHRSGKVIRCFRNKTRKKKSRQSKKHKGQAFQASESRVQERMRKNTVCLAEVPRKQLPLPPPGQCRKG